MTLLSDWAPKADARAGKMFRTLRAILTAAEGGITWADNIGKVVKFTATSTALGSAAVLTTYPLPLKQPPHSVFLIRAKSELGTQVVTGCAVKWAWANDVLTIEQISDLTSGVTYAVELGVMMPPENG